MEVQTDDTATGDWELQKAATGAAGWVCAAAAAKGDNSADEWVL